MIHTCELLHIVTQSPFNKPSGTTGYLTLGVGGHIVLLVATMFNKLVSSCSYTYTQAKIFDKLRFCRYNGAR